MELFLIIGFAVVILVFLYYKKLGFSSKEGNFEYIKIGDPNAQNNYDKEKTSEIPRLTAKELLELSWKFLYDVTEAVLYKFSATSRKSTHDCGDVLVQNGARYTHVVDYTPVRNVAKRRTVDDDGDDPTALQR